MNAERLLALYDRVADAPDAVDRLRRFVLDLAMRGKLVEQDPADEPVGALLAQARRRLWERAKSAKRVRWKGTGPVTPDEIKMGRPQGWLPARVNDTGLYVNGLAFKPADWKQSGTPIIRIQNLTDPAKGFNFASGNFPDEVVVRTGDILVSWSATLRAFRWERGKGVLNQHIFRVIPDDSLTTREFLLLLLKNAVREMAESRHAHGLVMKHINRGPFLNHVVLIPPLAEQRRIVTKVDELMALCDRLEESRRAREDTRDRLTKASLTRLTALTAPDTDAAAFRAHARFAVDALVALTARADQVEQLRQTILNLAVRGKLVEQNPADEPASELLKRIEVQRAMAPNARGQKSHVRGIGDSDPDLPDVPNGWQWTPLARISDVTMGQSPPGDTYNRSGDGVPLINGPVEFTAGPFGRTIINKFTTAPRKLCEEGDLLICVRGSTTGRTNVAAFRACIGRGVAAIRSSFDDGFIRLFLWKARGDIISMGRGMAFPSISKKQLENLAIPLAPLAEQRRIVAKVDELMALCERLEARLAAIDGTRKQLWNSLSRDAVGSHEATITGRIGDVTRVGR